MFKLLGGGGGGLVGEGVVEQKVNKCNCNTGRP